MGLTLKMTKSLTLLRNFTKGSHSRITNPWNAVLEHINNMRQYALNCLDKFRWKKNQEVDLTVQMTESLTLLRNFTKGSYSRITNRWSVVLEHINNMRHHTLNCLDKFRWKKESRRLTMQVTKSLTLLRKFTKGSHSRTANL